MTRRLAQDPDGSDRSSPPRACLRLAWPDVWACEDGPIPKRARIARYKEDLLCKKTIAGALRVSVRTIERWIEDGLPTRNVFGAVRCNPHDVTDWLKLRGVDLPQGWWA